MLKSARGETGRSDGRRAGRRGGPLILPALFALLACDGGGVSTHHDAYAEGLRRSGLAEQPAGAAWIEAGQSALAAAAPAELPLRAEGWFPDDSAAARAWRVAVPNGQRVFVSARLDGRQAGRLFLEVFRVPRDTADPPFAIASADDTTRVLEVDAGSSDELLIRLQPELLRGGRYELGVGLDASFAVAREGVPAASTQPGEEIAR